MPTSCAAHKCVIRYKKGLNVKFHRFPKDEILRNKWLRAVGRKDYNPSATAVICSNHFKTDDYYINYCGTKVLKTEAVPSIFDFPKSLEKKNSRKILIRNGTEASLNPAEDSGELYVKEEYTPAKDYGELYVKEEESIPSASQSSQTSLDEEELILSTSQASQTPIKFFYDSTPDVIGHESSAPKSGTNIKRRRSVPVHVGDFEESDLENPRKRHEYWNISQSIIQKYRKYNKYLHCQLHRSNKKIIKLNGLIDDLRNQKSCETIIVKISRSP